MPMVGVVFDLDGTLADTLADLTDAVNTGLGAIGYSPRSAGEVRRWVGEGMQILCRRAIAAAASPGAAVDDALVAAMAEAFTAYYRQHRLDKTVAYPGIPLLLDELAARGVRLAVFSNKPHEHTVELVDALFKRWPWAAVEGARDDRPRKPDPGAILAVVTSMKLHPAEVLVVGDSAIDVQAAHNAGAVAVGVTWGFRDLGELVQAG
jgi:phosphoglycolate phosphatase